MLQRFTTAFLIALLLLVPSYRAVAPLPDRLSDSAFWQFIEDASEPDGEFFSENLSSNELGMQYVIPPLLERVKAGGAYIGVGPEQNFTYIAALHPKIAFIVDIRRQNLVEHLLYKAIFEMSANRVEFLSMLFARKAPSDLSEDASVTELLDAFASVPANGEEHARNLQSIRTLLMQKHGFALTPQDLTGIDHVYDEFVKQGMDLQYSVSDRALLARMNRITDVPQIQSGISNSIQRPPGDPRLLAVQGLVFPTYADVMDSSDAAGHNWSYLSSEENYRTIREMEQKNLIVPLVGDFAGPKAIRAVGKYVKEHDSDVSVFYLSNVEQYLNKPELFQGFYENAATLPLNPSSTFIRSAQGRGAQPGIAQSSISPMKDVIDAVLGGDVRSQQDLLLMWH